jgi:hypothetical protein
LPTNPTEEQLFEFNQARDHEKQNMDAFVKKYGHITIQRQQACLFKEMLDETRELNIYKTHTSVKKRPVERLDPRTALQIPVGNVYNCFYDLLKSPGTSFIGLDVSALYGYAALFAIIPAGIPKILIASELDNVKCVNNSFYYKNKKTPIIGLFHCQILCPEGEELPFAAHQMKSGQWVNSVCRSCAEKQSVLPCGHGIDDRSFTTTYTSLDIENMLNLGYQVLQIYEIWMYPKSDYSLRSFIQVLLTEKLKSEKIDKTKVQQLCDDANRTLSLEGDTKLQPSDFVENLSRRSFYKALINAILGKY